MVRARGQWEASTKLFASPQPSWARDRDWTKPDTSLCGVACPLTIIGLGIGLAAGTSGVLAAILSKIPPPAPGLPIVARYAGHHASPKYLDGAALQHLARLPTNLHQLYQAGLDKILPRAWSAEFYTKLHQAADRGEGQIVYLLGTYTRAFDRTHGTKIYEALVREGFPNPF